VPPFVAVDPASTNPTDRAIGAAQDRLRAKDGDDGARLALAGAFLQKLRETADPSYYARVGGLLDDLATRRKDDPTLLILQGTFALAQHRFRDALDLGHRALRAAPGTAAAYGVLVDASNELGLYEEALAGTQAMADIRPDLAALSRVSYARELRGDVAGAASAMAQAASAGGEAVAFVQTQLGHLLLTAGNPAGAAVAYAAAETAFPGYPSALAGKARLRVAAGDPAGAAELLTKALEVQPLPEFAIARGDALRAAGMETEAMKAYALVDVLIALQRANGVDIDLELALFRADHGPGRSAVAQARVALARRPSQLAHDVLAWNLYQAGDIAEAVKESAKALALGTKDPQIRYHAAAIAHRAGDVGAARENLQIVLAANPRFSAVLTHDVAQLALDVGLVMPQPWTTDPTARPR
jgi:tetratricopeptide (TPR) repeat protein